MKESTTIPVTHTFSSEEISEMTDNLVSLIHEKTSIEIEKKSVTAEYNSKIKDRDKRIKKIASLIEDGETTRDIACEVEYHKPDIGKKTIVRSDTNESWIEDMTDEEFNLFNQKLMEGEEE